LICGALADLACPNANQDQHLDDQAIRATPTYGSRLTQKGPLGLPPVHTPSAARRPTFMDSSTPKVVAEYAQ
jgi:hypothetical protein